MTGSSVSAAGSADLEARTDQFVNEVIRPQAAAMAHGRGMAPDALVRAAGEHGLAGLLLPAEHGGLAAGHRAFTRFIEAIARECASSSVILDVHLSVGSEPILVFGTDEQRRRHLPGIAAGRTTAAFALTEPGSGSDAGALQTRAQQVAEGYRLTGTKAFITNGGAAGIYTVMARTGPRPRDITAFIVPADAPGLRCGPPLQKMGLRGSWTAELVLDDVHVPADARLGEEGQGFAVAIAALDSGRLGIAAQAVGIVQGCIDTVVAAAADDVDEGRLADLGVAVAAGRLLTAHAADMVDAGLPVTREAAIAKLFATDSAMIAAHAAVEMTGPHSARDGHPAAIRFRDAKACQIYEGTNQVQRIVISRAVLRD